MIAFAITIPTVVIYYISIILIYVTGTTPERELGIVVRYNWQTLLLHIGWISVAPLVWVYKFIAWLGREKY